MEIQNPMSFEQGMAELERIVSILEKGDSSLEETIALYEEGKKLSMQLNDILKNGERRIRALTEEGEHLLAEENEDNDVE